MLPHIGKTVRKMRNVMLVDTIFINNLHSARIIVASLGNVACLISAAFLAFLSTTQPWSRLIAFWSV